MDGETERAAANASGARDSFGRMTSDEFRRLGHELIDFIADYRLRTERGEFPVMAQVQPGALRARLPAAPPQRAESGDALLHDLEQLILPACSHWQDPRFFGYFPSNSLPAAVLGDLASTGLAQLGLNWQASPALTELEEVTTDWLRQMLGLSDAWRGVIQDTASTASFVALVSARERATQYGATRGGLQAAAASLVVYVSSQSHSSVAKAAMLAGFGRTQLREVPVDEAFAMRADALALMLAEDRAAGRVPCAIVATCGTTATTALDPIDALAALAEQYDAWLHVDAALAGSAMILPECRGLWQGVERADSLVVNPHKWLGVAFDCSVYYVRDPKHLVRVMSSNPSYLQTAADGAAPNYRDWGVPLGRRMRSLKLWFVIREQGVEGLQGRIRRDLAYAQWFAAAVDRARDWRRLAPVPLQTVCVRHEPPALTGAQLDAHTLAWVGRINTSGQAWLTPAQIDGKWMVRVSFGTHTTTQQHVEQLWALMRREALADIPGGGGS
ncbi:MAG TPA: pyridoxal-dependent decarboxylase [Steroidobacteraceae bacterium]|nr:pyridoxal-dependent decarboxylase [Steroidobacteraceae bacterium]HRX89507.1 pyridoxal-dependent decarboxylase [Steroidobacteraceae bacterium]